MVLSSPVRTCEQWAERAALYLPVTDTHMQAGRHPGLLMQCERKRTWRLGPAPRLLK